jgi:hypothetical protein
MPFARHHEIALKSSYIEIKVTGLNNEGHIDICGDHLELNIAAWSFPSQKRLSRQDIKDARVGAGVVIPHADPVSDAGQIGGGFAGVDGSACEFRGDFTLRIPDDVLVAIYRSHPRETLNKPPQKTATS